MGNRPHKDPKRYLPRHIWYRAEADLLIRKLQEAVWPLNYHVALGGGVLNHGYSDGDLDIYLLPIYTKEWTPDYLNIRSVVQDALGTTVEDMTHYYPGRAFKFEWIAMPQGKRVDVFVVDARVEECPRGVCPVTPSSVVTTELQVNAN